MTEFYPVFCTVDVPSELLDQLIEQSKEAITRIGGVGSLVILESTDISVISSGTPTPTKEFRSPFLDWSLDKVHKAYLKDIQSKKNWTANTFAVLDQRNVAEKTVLLACSLKQGLETRRSDFYASLFELVSVEMGTWLFEDDDTDERGILTRETCEERMPKE